MCELYVLYAKAVTPGRISLGITIEPMDYVYTLWYNM